MTVSFTIRLHSRARPVSTCSVPTCSRSSERVIASSVERARLATETVTESQQVSEQVRKEQIEQVIDAPEDRPRR